MKENRIIVLGGSGFLGQSIAKRFGNSVFIADIIEPKSNSSNSFIYFDILDYTNVLKVIKEFDLIINCTGQITNPINKSFLINTKGIKNLVQALSIFPEKKLIHISTVSIFGTSSIVDENTTINPESPYASAKAFAEYIITSNLKNNYSILRIPNLYGLNQQKGVFAYLLKSFKTDRNLFFNNDGTLTRYYLHIDDCSDAIFQVAENQINGIYNIPSNDKYSLLELIKLIEEKLNFTYNVFFEPIKPNENIEILKGDKFLQLYSFKEKNSVSSFINNNFIL